MSQILLDFILYSPLQKKTRKIIIMKTQSFIIICQNEWAKNKKREIRNLIL